MSVRVHLDDVNAGEMRYLEHRYPADADERRERIRLTLKRLIRAEKDPSQVHQALMLGIARWSQHRDAQMTRTQARRWNARVAKVRKDFDRALTGLRRLLPENLHSSDAILFEFRDQWLRTMDLPTAKRGRPWQWYQEADAALRQAGVSVSDRRELMSALGFVDAE